VWRAGQEADSQREPLFCRYWAPPGAAEVSSTCDVSHHCQYVYNALTLYASHRNECNRCVF
jgi:hypothetical protein